MVANRVALLFENRFWSRGVVNDGHVVAIVGMKADPYVCRNPLPFIPKLARTIAAPAG